MLVNMIIQPIYQVTTRWMYVGMWWNKAFCWQNIRPGSHSVVMDWHSIQFYVHINAIGWIYEGNISKQHQHPKIAQTVYQCQWEMEGCEVNNTTINGGAGGYNRLLRGHLTQSTSILCLRRMGNTQHNTHITIVGIICKYTYENRGYIIHIAQGYHHRIFRWKLLLRMTHSGMSYSMWYLGENHYKL